MARRFPGRSLFVLFTVALVVATVDRVNRPSRASTQQDAAPGEWRAYGRDPGGTRFSPLTQLTPANVGQLQLAWTYHIGEKERLPNISPDREPPAFEATPLIVGNTLYVVTPSSRMIALDAESGRERWRFDPQAGEAARSYHQHRGAAYWEGDGQNSGPARRLLYGTLHGDLVCLDADTGRVCAGFGVNGRVSLRTRRTGVSQKTLNAMTSAPAIYRDIVIVGTRVQESPAQGPAGVVRAFDVRSGRPLWDFRGIPRSEESGADTWEGSSWRDRSGANVWSTMSVDVERGMVFLPVGSPTYDFFGGDRKGQNLFGNSLVALAARTGRRIWHFQMVHHDIWDYDIPAQPVLATIRRRNRSQDVVVQVTKMGLVFVLDRGDGTPVFPVAERAVPSAGVPGESPWPTQPFPTLPQPLVRHAITRADLSDVTPESAKFCRALFDSVHGGRIYTPMGTEHTLVVPGNLGGANWSGAAFDSRSRRLFVNVNELPLVAALESDQGAMPTISHYRRFVDEQGRPCVKPPWGLLVAIDLDSGSVAWRSPLGNDESVRASRPTGLPSLGGAIATAGGLVFIAGTTDRRIRAFDASDGRELWSAALDASGHATPATYFSDRSRRQFVVIAAGGGGYLSPDRVSDTLAAFALPASPSQ
jgi:quinoprotein glucose dehydrogenase